MKRNPRINYDGIGYCKKKKKQNEHRKKNNKKLVANKNTSTFNINGIYRWPMQVSQLKTCVAPKEKKNQ